MDNVKDKIRKLLAMGQSPNEHEAAIALAKAAELMMRHNLAESDVVEKRFIHSDLIDTERKRYLEIIANAVAQVTGSVAMFTSRDSGLFNFIGKPMAVETAKAMYDFIVEQLEAAYKRFLPKGMTKGERAEYRRTFKLAMSLRVGDRLLAIDAQYAPGGAKAGENALIVLKDQDQRDAAASVGVSMTEGRDVTIRPTRGTFEGYAAADAVRLQNTIK